MDHVDSRREGGRIPVYNAEQHVQQQLEPELSELAVVPALLGQLLPLRFVLMHSRLPRGPWNA